jgi:hypothetical protein
MAFPVKLYFTGVSHNPEILATFERVMLSPGGIVPLPLDGRRSGGVRSDEAFPAAVSSPCKRGGKNEGNGQPCGRGHG